ncbi:hypothetical protein LGQ02_16605 [Bacillus shivajii]|uniref:hypothetical protein n=1 Tax=Bacillus shivajii TaxID=1983719 RepID=UPI001CFB7265|nr:hypothetical protein [Bacillus shivajii]UCZ52443.1 hypothetical protein LGQ02_16605 [Bacillus shivajii]
MSSFKKMITILGITLLLSSMVSVNLVFANDEELDSFTEKLQDWEEEGIDSNHTEVIEALRNYIFEQIDDDVFASLHIDREQRDLGVIVLSFTEEINDEHKEQLKSLAEDPAELVFRIVDYTEDELIEKQREIDLNAFEADGIEIHYTSVDVVGNTVEVGISPFNETNRQMIYDHHGSDMVNVVAGEKVMPFNEGESIVVEDQLVEKDVQNQNFFQSLFQSIRSWFSNIF